MRRIPAPEQDRLLKGLRPLSGTTPRVLVLGSFPSALSLVHNEYYGNPRNRFWAVIEELFSIPPELPYAERTLRLMQEKIALWDVIRSCARTGSADSRIRSPAPNDIAGFVRRHPTLRLIALNGSMAGRLYHRLPEGGRLTSVTLPSTSPANAALTFAEKVRAWEIVKMTASRE